MSGYPADGVAAGGSPRSSIAAGRFGPAAAPPMAPWGFLRALDIRVMGSRTAEYRRPARAAERTRSRRARAVARRTRRYELDRRGPSGARAGYPFDAPFGPITGIDLYTVNQIRRWAPR